MKPRVAVLDSLNFSSSNLEALFLDKQKYNIEEVKSIGVFEPQRWLEEFGKPLTRNIKEAKILHTDTGLALPIKRFSSRQDKQTLEFAGLHSYNDKSKDKRELLSELREYIQDEVITRIDVATDFKGAIPQRVIKALHKHRRYFKYQNSVYMKTAKEKRSNPNINICIYPKHKKRNNNLNYELERLEFSFRSAYFRGQYKIKNIDEAYKKMQKTIMRMIGLDVQIQAL